MPSEPLGRWIREVDIWKWEVAWNFTVGSKVEGDGPEHVETL